MSRPVIGVTYNSYELDTFLSWRLMLNGIVAAGGTPLAIDCAHPAPQVPRLVKHLDGLILSGGGDIHPHYYGGNPRDPLLRGINRARDEAEMTALRTARREGIPVLGICRGAQLINVALGGTLYADLSRDRGVELNHRFTEEALVDPLHKVTVSPDTHLAFAIGQPGCVPVNSQHHQGIRDLAESLVASAYSPDRLVEGFESREGAVMGVQWHPEVLWPTEEHALRLLKAFVSMSRKPSSLQL